LIGRTSKGFFLRRRRRSIQGRAFHLADPRGGAPFRWHAENPLASFRRVMKRLFALLVCALVFAVNACEKHSASELADEHGAGEKHDVALPHQPAGMPSNPTGSGPTDAPMKRGDEPSEAGKKDPSPKFFQDKK
jgi:hypothetical protein